MKLASYNIVFPPRATAGFFAITEKIFPVIYRDGETTVEELIRADLGAALLAETYLRRFGQMRAKVVLAQGEVQRLVEAKQLRPGLHFPGRETSLEQRLDAISKIIPRFHSRSIWLSGSAHWNNFDKGRICDSRVERGGLRGYECL